jgi:alpha-1,3-glucan synthase
LVPPKSVPSVPQAIIFANFDFRYLQIKLGDWPIYSFLLALGQVIASSSYQITLLTGEIGQSPEKLYVVASVYLVASIMWGVLGRFVKSVYLLSIPFFFYGVAFVLVGASPFLQGASKLWMQNVATGIYAIASASGALFFAFNFGDEGMDEAAHLNPLWSSMY